MRLFKIKFFFLFRFYTLPTLNRFLILKPVIKIRNLKEKKIIFIGIKSKVLISVSRQCIKSK